MAPLVLLDVNETLVSLERLRARFPRPELLETWLASTLRDGMALATAGGCAPFADVARDVLVGMLGDEDAAARVLDGLADLRLHEDVVPGLRALRERGARAVTFTNGSAEQTRAWLAAGGAAELVEDCLSVAQAGRWKPAPEAYRWALERCGVQPRDATLVAVHPWDVHGAQRAGLRGAWLDRAGGAPYPRVFGAPDVRAGDLPALVAALLR